MPETLLHLFFVALGAIAAHSLVPHLEVELAKESPELATAAFALLFALLYFGIYFKRAAFYHAFVRKPRRFIARTVARVLVRGFSYMVLESSRELEDSLPDDANKLIERNSLLSRAYAAMLLEGFRQLAIQYQTVPDGADSVNRSSLWDWLTDQIIVLKGRYAFSMSCIAFRRNNGRLQCLFVRRKFEDFGETPVLTWSGGRVMGIADDPFGSLAKRVEHETGCQVEFIPLKPKLIDTGGLTEGIHSVDKDSKPLQNTMLAEPAAVMMQNRSQRNGIRGHLDLIYVARVVGDANKNPEAVFVGIDDFKDYLPTQLWPDARICVQRAGELFEAYEATEKGRLT